MNFQMNVTSNKQFYIFIQGFYSKVQILVGLRKSEQPKTMLVWEALFKDIL